MIFFKIKVTKLPMSEQKKIVSFAFDARQRAIQLEKNANSYSLQLTAVFYQNLI